MKVLIAIDQSDFARAIINFVINHKWPADTKMTILSIVKPTKINNAMAVLPGPLLDEIEERQCESAKKLVANTAKSIRQTIPKIELEEIVMEGFPKEDILNYTRANAVDLIILGSHGRTEIGRLFLGSVSMAVMSHAPCSVAIVHLDGLASVDEESAKAIAPSSLLEGHEIKSKRRQQNVSV